MTTDAVEPQICFLVAPVRAITLSGRGNPFDGWPQEDAVALGEVRAGVCLLVRKPLEPRAILPLLAGFLAVDYVPLVVPANGFNRIAGSIEAAGLAKPFEPPNVLVVGGGGNGGGGRLGDGGGRLGGGGGRLGGGCRRFAALVGFARPTCLVIGRADHANRVPPTLGRKTFLAVL